MNRDLIEKLINIYNVNSKHSNYQKLASNFDGIIDTSCLNVFSRYEDERFSYIKKHVALKNQNILDIGGNTGYFTFESVNEGASHVDYYEGNKKHAQFVKLACDAFGFSDLININNDYFTFSDDLDCKKYDVIFLLNVLHHVGDDYGNVNSISEAKKNIIKEINNLSFISKYLVFQLGFNWKGNKDYGLFDNGEKSEMIEFIKKGTKGKWSIKNIAIAEQDKRGDICYCDISDTNIIRNDSLGEFLNRPLFVMESF
ncbi:MAG: class I SAM-dependent methyltransferase [Lachnospiraceae bacterium]|jgi:hypothetical protein|nr:class I SAM-dependent methyltransferase [Lachnospiraceae bacterium]